MSRLEIRLREEDDSSVPELADGLHREEGSVDVIEKK